MGEVCVSAFLSATISSSVCILKAIHKRDAADIF